MAHKRRRAAGGASGYEVDYSCRFNDDDSAYTQFTTDDIGGSNTTMAWGVWVKRGNLSSVQYIFGFDNDAGGREQSMRFDASDRIEIVFNEQGGARQLQYVSTQVFRDPHSWYHISGYVDTTPASPEFKLWVNGVEVTVWTTSTNALNQNDTLYIGSSIKRLSIGATAAGASFFDGLISQLAIQDGQTISDATNYGETDANGVFRPVDITGLTFGTGGFLLDFAVAPGTGNGAGTDVSGNANHFTDNNLAANDQVVDVPSNNFATVSSIHPTWSAAVTHSDGNLAIAGTAATVWNVAVVSQTVTEGKWILAYIPLVVGSGRGDPFVFDADAQDRTEANPSGTSANAWGMSFDTSSGFSQQHTGNNHNCTMSPIYATGDYGLIAFDADAKKVWFGWYDVSTTTLSWGGTTTNFDGDPAAGTGEGFTVTGTRWGFAFELYTGRSCEVDFGQRNDILSNITIPTGFNFLNTTNLAVPAIADGADEFVLVVDTESNIEATLATARTGWSSYVDILKNRDSAEAWIWRWSNDSSNETLVVLGNLTYQSKVAVSGSDNWIGMSIKVDGTAKVRAGSTGHTNGSPTTVTFTTVGTTDYAVFIHDRGADEKFVLAHPNTSSGKNIPLNSGATENSGTGYDLVTSQAAAQFVIASGEPTGTYDWLVLPQSDLISLDGYTPNLNADGPVVLMSQSPKAVIVRANNGISNTYLIDVVTQKYNAHGTTLKMNTDYAEGGTTDFDLLGNGLKLRKNDDANEETSCVTIAFADNPFGGHGGTFGNGVSPATAR